MSVTARLELDQGRAPAAEPGGRVAGRDHLGQPAKHAPHDCPLHAAAAAVHQAQPQHPGLAAGAHVLLDHRRDVGRREGVQVELAVQRQLHRVRLLLGHCAARRAATAPMAAGASLPPGSQQLRMLRRFYARYAARVDEPAPLPPADLDLLLRGAEQFESGLYFECHETLEELWSGLRGPLRGAVQGLIQLAVAQHHLARGNLVGARSLLERALPRLQAAPARLGDVDVTACRGHAQGLLAWLVQGGGGSPPAPPRWRSRST